MNFKILPFTRGGWRGIAEYYQNRNAPTVIPVKTGIQKKRNLISYQVRNDNESKVLRTQYTIDLLGNDFIHLEIRYL